ncbi:MAG: phosphatidylserine decarboxylase family protein [Tepidisphaeraceae bacterium]|jgi:phosphatidylserine decarboxylase
MLPLTRHGWRELLIGTLLLAAIAFGFSLLWHPLALLVLPFLIFLFAFFRDPDRPITTQAGAIVSPADGTVSDITEIAHDELLGGPAVRIGIFLSVFNVHVNRSPCDGRVLTTRYKKGLFINALHHDEASTKNESNTIVLAAPTGDQPVAVVKQIVGLIARRIVCTIKPGDPVTRGQRIGMIKFGSRTELYLPKRLNPQIQVAIGQKVRGAADIVAIMSA